MKPLSLLVAGLFPMILLSCGPSLDIPVDQPMEEPPAPIQTDKEVLSFTSAGGSQSMTMTNYESWGIVDGYERALWMGDHYEWFGVVYPSSSIPDADLCDRLDGGWYSATVPNGGFSNQISVTVKENTSGEVRQATIDMRAGEAYGTVSVWQDK